LKQAKAKAKKALTGHWILVIGHWKLVIGYWILVNGYWSLKNNCVSLLSLIFAAQPELKQQIF